MQTPSKIRSWIPKLRTRTTYVPEKRCSQSWNRGWGWGYAWSPSPRQTCYWPVPGLSSAMPARSPEGPFLSCEPSPASNTKKQMGSPELVGERGALWPPQINTTPCSPPPQPRLNRPAGESRLLQARRGGAGQGGEEWVRAERTNLPSSLRAHLSNSAAWRETCFIVILATGAWEPGQGGGAGPGFPVALTLGWVRGHALPLSNQRGQALGGGCPGPRALASHPVLKGAAVSKQGWARDHVSFLPHPAWAWHPAGTQGMCDK